MRVDRPLELDILCKCFEDVLRLAEGILDELQDLVRGDVLQSHLILLSIFSHLGVLEHVRKGLPQGILGQEESTTRYTWQVKVQT